MKTLRIKYPTEISEVKIYQQITKQFNFLHFPNTTIINMYCTCNLRQYVFSTITTLILCFFYTTDKINHIFRQLCL